MSRVARTLISCYEIEIHNSIKNRLLIISSKPHPQSSAPETASLNAVFSKPFGTTVSIIFLNASARNNVNSTKPVDTAIHGTNAAMVTKIDRQIFHQELKYDFISLH